MKERLLSEFEEALAAAQPIGNTDQIEAWAQRLIENYEAAAECHKKAVRKVESFEVLALGMKGDSVTAVPTARANLRFWLSMLRAQVPGMRALLRTPRQVKKP